MLAVVIRSSLDSKEAQTKPTSCSLVVYFIAHDKHEFGHCFALHYQILGIFLLVGHHLATRFDQVSAFQDAVLTFTMRSR